MNILLVYLQLFVVVVSATRGIRGTNNGLLVEGPGMSVQGSFNVSGKLQLGGRLSGPVKTAPISPIVNDLDVSDATTIAFDTSSNHVVLNGFAAGEEGQIVYLFKGSGDYTLTISHDKQMGGGHPFITGTARDIVLGYGYGGCTAIYRAPALAWVLTGCNGKNYLPESTSNAGRQTVSGDSVRGMSTYFVDSSGGDVVINGFKNGVIGQYLSIVKTTYEGQVKIVHGNSMAGIQPIVLPTSQDRNSIAYNDMPLTLQGYGSVSAVYSGSAWHVQGPSNGNCRKSIAVFRNLQFMPQSNGILTVAHMRDSTCGQPIPKGYSSFLVMELIVQERLGGARICHVKGPKTLDGGGGGGVDIYCTSDFTAKAGTDNKPPFQEGTPSDKYFGLSFYIEWATDKIYLKRSSLSESASIKWDLNVHGTFHVQAGDRDDTHVCLPGTGNPCPSNLVTGV